jgi:Na+/H+-dicarboxylate symporter
MTTYLIQLIVTVVPLLIFAALSPAVATLVKRGLAGRFATSVVLWYVTSSTVAGLYALVVSSLIFDIPFASETAGAWSDALGMLRSFGEQSSVSRPLLAIVGAILLGAVSVGIPPLYAFLVKIEEGIARVGHRLGYIMLPLILCLGVTIGVRFGARVGMGHYVTMTAYTALLCFGWWLFYVFVVIRYLAKRRPAKLLTTYYVPTALFAAGTCSSLATLPVNLSNVKAYGVRDEVADFLLPFGAVANMDGSALAYIAYAPFVLSHIFGIEISWTLLLLAWPAVVLFTTAAPGLPAGIGTALWSSTLFASMLGLDGQLRGDFVATWIALAGGLPDMFRSATNTTGDGFTAVVFDSIFDRFFAPDHAASTVPAQ